MKVSVHTAIDIELTDSEKEHLIRAYRILLNLAMDMWDEKLHETEYYFHVEDARDGLETVLQNLGIENYEAIEE